MASCNCTDNKLRIFWRFFQFAATIATIWLVLILYKSFLNNPTVTTLINSSHPVSKIPFPAISICSLNKISKKRAQILANHLANLTQQDPRLMMTYIQFVGQLYDFDFKQESIKNLLQFQKILDLAGLTIINLVKTLTIPCNELLNSCTWQRVRINCSEIFLMRLTYEGYCCVFNYIKEIPNERTTEKMPLTTESGLENGLSVEITNKVDDYFYSTLSSVGVTAHVFFANDYPDKVSGSLNEILIESKSENFLEIVPTTVKAVKDVMHYPVPERECLFDTERRTVVGKAYSQSDCYVECRLESILALCKCVPFKMPVSNDNTVCTLEDIPCLNRYRDKWFTILPDHNLYEHLSREIQDSLSCKKKCYPTCSETLYSVLINSFPIFNKTLLQRNVTVAHIYYGRRFSNLYEQDVVYYWFEILSNFGGMFGILMGFSFISLIEICVLVVKKICKHLHCTGLNNVPDYSAIM